MDLEKPPSRPQQPEGCLVVALRLPVRIIALVVVLPVRMAWDALVVGGRCLTDTVLRPAGRVLQWLYARVLTPVGHGLARIARGIGAALGWLYARVLAPVGRGIAWLVRYLVVVPARWLYEWVLAPVGRGIAWLAGVIGAGVGAVLYWTTRVLVVLPALALWNRLLAPVGRALAVVAHEVGEALGHAWRIAGRISQAVGRGLGTLFRWIFADPLRWVYRTVLTPVGHVVRDAVVRPVAEAARVAGRAVGQALSAARDTVRQARADLRRMLLGEPRPPAAVDRREPTGRATRTLGSSTTALTKD
ncbi:hypothetical protein AQI88_34225 [Streptomyces cellostaticus]|uniref:Uncharacterized protein n=1 Tax=Streptomyces cellostaticus TaxID=67285 RepID=A0A117PU66_9ACTN|nr:hypothetical protein [Streptomyces cellostaticus]KUM92045.1 hypothetical protein AQI88_34225 [Streptomyces cellostaticus]GHI07773.1 hypothetical protein Scel_60940 [Streptomyces cellostaticus]